jgi:hypothetical protein
MLQGKYKYYLFPAFLGKSKNIYRSINFDKLHVILTLLINVQTLYVLAAKNLRLIPHFQIHVWEKIMVLRMIVIHCNDFTKSYCNHFTLLSGHYPGQSIWSTQFNPPVHYVSRGTDPAELFVHLIKLYMSTRGDFWEHSWFRFFFFYFWTELYVCFLGNHFLQWSTVICIKRYVVFSFS